MKDEKEKPDEILATSNQVNKNDTDTAPTKVPFDISAYTNVKKGNEINSPALHTNAAPDFKDSANNNVSIKKYITIEDGSLLVPIADGDTTTLSHLHNTMNVGDKISNYCINPNHVDNNASGFIQKHESGDLFCGCSGCGVNSWFRGDIKKSINKKPVKELLATLPLTGSPKINLLDKQGKKKNQSNLLIEMGKHSHLFHDVNDNRFIVVEINGVKQTYNLRSGECKEYLIRLIYLTTGSGVSDRVIKETQNALSSVAKFDGPMEETGIRVINKENYTLLDTCNDKGQIMKIDETGINYVNDSPIHLLKMKGMTPFPEYINNDTYNIEDINLLRKYLPDSEEIFSLIFGWICCSLAGTETLPIAVLQGSEGCGKSTLTRICRSFVDPSSTPLRSPNGGLENLINDAENSYGTALDNISSIDLKLSNMLSKFSTGIGFTKRQLQTDNGIHLINLKRPIIINGITYLGTQPDFISRCFIVDLPTMPPSKRISNRAFWSDFEKDRKAIFRAFLNAIVSGYQHKDDVIVEYKTRLLGETEWIAACERNLGMEGNFEKAYKANHERANQNNIDSCPIGNAIQILMSTRRQYTGTTADLLRTLTDITDPSQTHSREWPKALKTLFTMIDKIKSSLEKTGINITKEKNGDREYVIVNTKFKQEKSVSIFGNGGDSTPSDDGSDDNYSDDNSSVDLPDWVKK